MERSSQKGTVRDCNHQKVVRCFVKAAVDGDRRAAVSEELPERGVDVTRLSPEELDARACLEDAGIESESTAVDEIVTVGTPDVDSRARPRRHEVSDIGDGQTGYAKDLGEVVARSRRHNGESGTRSGSK